MSGFSSPRDGAAAAHPKQISNRLLNMKFMQRAAASTTQKPGGSPSTPTGQPTPKRRRTEDYTSTPSKPNTPLSAHTPTYHDRTTIPLSSEAQGSSISSRIHNLGLEGDETEWVLNVSIPTITNGNKNANGANDEGYDSQEEDDDDNEEEEIWSTSNPSGRQTYGSFNKKKKKTNPIDVNADSSNNSAKKRMREDDDLDDGEISSGSDDDNSVPGGSSEGEQGQDNDDELGNRSTQNTKKKRGTFNFKSEADLKKMDSLDFQKSGFEHGLGRQRAGLSGGGGGGGGGYSGTGAFKGPGPGPSHTTAKNRPKKKARKSRR